MKKQEKGTVIYRANYKVDGKEWGEDRAYLRIDFSKLY
jgi:hypothetical protein